MQQQFAKLYQVDGIGQVVVMLQHDDNQDPEIAFTFDPNIEGLGISSGSITWNNQAHDQEKREEAARRMFEKVDSGFAEQFVGKLLAEIRELMDDQEEGADHG